MNRNMILVTLIALGSLQATAGESDKGTDLWGGICNFINAFRQEERIKAPIKETPVKTEPYVLPIQDTDGYNWHTMGYYTKRSTTPGEVLVIQQVSDVTPQADAPDITLRKCIRFISSSRGMNGTKKADMNELPVRWATKVLVAEKLKLGSHDTVWYSDCYTSHYNNFTRNNLANSMRARSGSKQDIDKARAKSNIINEIPVQELHNDARVGAFDKLSADEAILKRHGISQEEQDRILRATRRRFERWQKSPSSQDVVYSDNFHDQLEKED